MAAGGSSIAPQSPQQPWSTPHGAGRQASVAGVIPASQVAPHISNTLYLQAIARQQAQREAKDQLQVAEAREKQLSEQLNSANASLAAAQQQLEAEKAAKAEAVEQLAALRAQKTATARSEAKKVIEEMKQTLKSAHATALHKAVRVQVRTNSLHCMPP